jgi:hypothetical protein
MNISFSDLLSDDLLLVELSLLVNRIIKVKKKNLKDLGIQKLYA